jgi:hypothetical protein
MTTFNRFYRVAGVIASSAIVMALPTLAHAASYAYVNQAGDINMVTANDWMTAIATAPNIDSHSGVLLINDSTDQALVGSSVW